MNVIDMNLQLALKKQTNKQDATVAVCLCMCKIYKNYFQVRIPETTTGE